jgi:hypothetical protein
MRRGDFPHLHNEIRSKTLCPECGPRLFLKAG